MQIIFVIGAGSPGKIQLVLGSIFVFIAMALLLAAPFLPLRTFWSNGLGPMETSVGMLRYSFHSSLGSSIDFFVNYRANSKENAQEKSGGQMYGILKSKRFE